MPTSFFSRRQSLMRHGAHASFWLFLLLALGFQLGVIDLGGQHEEWFLVWLCILSALGLVFPFVLTRVVPALSHRINNRMLGLLEGGGAVAMWSSWIGTFGLYDFSGYDTGVHILSSAIIAALCYTLLLALFPRARNRPFFTGTVVLVVTLSAGVINEVFEWGGDELFGTTMYGESGQPDDTWRDFVGNGIGLMVGLVASIRFKASILRFINGKDTV